MAKLVETKTFLNENITRFSERLYSPMSIFLDSTPTFTTYYHIATDISTVDNGFLNVEQILGGDSPIRFHKIIDFPIYGIESIILDLDDDDVGITTSYDAEGTILPGTIKPLPHDYFIISYLNNTYLFMVNDVNFDTIKSNNFYRINFSIKTITDAGPEKLDKQTTETYRCIFDNIGTENKCLVFHADHLKYNSINYQYKELLTQYKALFYNETFNSFIFENEYGEIIYDKYITYFINKNHLYSDTRDYNTLYLNNEDPSPNFFIEYNNSVYGNIEKHDIESIDYTRVMKHTLVNIQSIFVHYNMANVKTLLFNTLGSEYIPDTLIDNIKNNNQEDVSIFEEIIIGYFNDTINNITNIDLDKLNLAFVDNTYTDFLYVPIVLFIIKKIVMEFITK